MFVYYLNVYVYNNVKVCNLYISDQNTYKNFLYKMENRLYLTWKMVVHFEEVNKLQSESTYNRLR